MSKSITSLLGIQGWFKTEDIKDEIRSIHLFLKPLRKTAICPRCGKRTNTGYDKQPLRSILHTTIGEKLLYLHICPRRFVCPCNPSKPFRERFRGIRERRSTTKHFDRELLRHLAGQSFKTVERKYTLSYPSARMRLLEAVDPMDIRWESVSSLPAIHLGLDGHHLVNRRFVETIKRYCPTQLLSLTIIMLFRMPIRDLTKQDLSSRRSSIRKEQKEDLGE